VKTAQDLVAEAKKEINEVAVADASQVIHGAALLLDVREPAEYQQGHLAGAINIPRGLLEFKMGSAPEFEVRDQAIVLYCKTSGRSALAAASLKQMGYVNVTSIAGGYDAWAAAGMETVKPNLPEFA
jgi:rhodanese-related sulfurtransferase